MDELRRFCVRMLQDGPDARAAEEQARAGGGDRVAVLSAAVAACREREPAPVEPAPDSGKSEPPPGEPDDLARAVARELAAASARLSRPQRELLALRELLGLTHDEIAVALGADREAVAPALAQARMGLRAELRGVATPQLECVETDRALRTIALRQDGQPVPDADDEWLMEHLGHCKSCGQAHASMLEASACYRAWRPEEDGSRSSDASPTAPGGAGAGS
jgi:hypothetical protein